MMRPPLFERWPHGRHEAEPLRVHIMTATLSPGDAIGNYILSQRRLFESWGCRVTLYADGIAPALRGQAYHSSSYHPDGRSLLWYHYSIDSPNIAQAAASTDYKVMDYHGVTPPHLFVDNLHLARLCQQALDKLPAQRDRYDRFVVHTNYMVDALLEAQVDPAKIDVIPLCVDIDRFGGAARPAAAFTDALQQLDYLLFVGRIIPQKDILSMLKLFTHLQAQRPDLTLLLVGDRSLTPDYQQQLDRFVRENRLTERVQFTGPVYDGPQLAALIRHAQLVLILSEWESFCVPVAEAAYFGTPVVVADMAPLPEVAGPAGVVVDKTDPAGAARQVDALLDSPEHAQMRTAAAAWGQRYTRDALAINTLAALQRWFKLETA